MLIVSIAIGCKTKEKIEQKTNQKQETEINNDVELVIKTDSVTDFRTIETDNSVVKVEEAETKVIYNFSVPDSLTGLQHVTSIVKVARTATQNTLNDKSSDTRDRRDVTQVTRLDDESDYKSDTKIISEEKTTNTPPADTLLSVGVVFLIISLLAMVLVVINLLKK